MQAISRDIEVVWLNTKSDIFYIKSLYSSLSCKRWICSFIVLFEILGYHRGLLFSHGKLCGVGY